MISGRLRLVAALFAVAAVVLVPAAIAQPDAEEISGAGDYTGWTPLSLTDRSVTVFVELSGKPVTLVQAEKGRKLTQDEKAAIRSELRAAQSSLKPSIEKLGGKVLSDFQLALNGFKVQISGKSIGDLAELPGVSTIREIALIEPDHTTSVPFIGAPAAWDGAGGFRGDGVKVAVIDTGSDYTHANFGGPGTTVAYDSADAADTLPADPTMFGPAAPKVKGGIDLVGDDYNAGGTPAQQIPHPDPNPLDCKTGNAGGHGSHTSGTATGFGVKADGTTYTGPYDETTFSDPAAFTIGPGVAPKADLYAVRVFGCSGSTAVTIEAIEWSVDNGMDVINMSLGSAFGSAQDASAVASSNAAAAGVIVVASAGNNGASQYITGSPATGTGTISVAANDSAASFRAANINVSSGPITAINANGEDLPAGSFPVKVLRTSTGAVSLGCNLSDYFDAAGNSLVEGKIAVTVRGVCARVARAIHAEKAGAVAAVMINTDAGFPPFEGRITSNPDTGEPFEVTIPFLGVRGVLGPAATQDGDNLVAADGQSATLTEATISNPNFKGFASFSSGGPRRVDSWLKPDITGPGVSILSTGVGTGNQGRISSGTSMSAPHVAGVAALARQAHPSWSVEDIKASIVNTGDPSGVAGLRISRGGSGLVQPAKAVKTSVVAVGDPGTATLNYGFAEFASSFAATKNITLRNHGSSDVTFNVTTAGNTPFTSAHTATPSASSVTVPAGGTATVGVALSASGAAVGGSNAFKEIAGLVTFTPADSSMNAGVSLSVPYYLVPRPFSNIETSLANKGKFTGASPSTTATITNKGPAVSGTADWYAWGLVDGPEMGQGITANDLRAVGVQSFASPIPADPNRRLLVFAVNLHDRWSNAAVSEFDISVDVDLDGTVDYVVVGADAGLLLGTGAFDGRFAVGVFSTRSAGASVLFLATAPHDSAIALLPVRSTQLCRTGEPCLSVSNPRFEYSIASFALRSGSGDDEIEGTARFNGWSSSISQGMFAGPLAPGASASTTVAINAAEWAQTPALGVMVVSTEDKSGDEEAELIPVTFSP